MFVLQKSNKMQSAKETRKKKKQRLLVVTYDWLKMNLLMKAYISQLNKNENGRIICQDH